MVRLNLGTVDDSSVEKGGDAIPLGEYVCEVVGAEEKHTQAGQPYFNFGLKVVEGEYTGRYLGFDKLFFSERAIKRAKYILTRLGFDTSGDLDIEAESLNGHFAIVKNKHTPKCPACNYDVAPAETKGLVKCTHDTCTWVGKSDQTKPVSEPDYSGYTKLDGAPRTASPKDTDFNPAELEGGGSAKDDEVVF